MAGFSSKCSGRARPACWVGACLTLAAFIAPLSAYEADPRFIFISSPTKRNVYFAHLPSLADASGFSADRVVQKAQVIIDGTISNASGLLGTEAADKGLVQPEGLAVWHGKKNAWLYVADAGAYSIYAYQITGTIGVDPNNPSAMGSVQVGPQQLVVKDINSVSGLALDGYGNLYFSTIDGTVGVVKADTLDPIKSPAATILYSSDSAKTVSSPYSIAADNFNVFWTNSANGQAEGVVIKAFERDAKALAEKYPDFPKPLAKNAAKAVGVCIAKNNVFFTGDAQFLYGVKTSGGGITEVSRAFQVPRACAYDGENTLYVADLKAGAVYSLPANFPTLRPVQSVQKVVDVLDINGVSDEPSGVAVFSRAEAYVMQQADNGFLGLGF